MKVLIKKVFSQVEIQLCLMIRRKVFIEGQNVPEAIEQDGKDEASDHYLLLIDEKPAGVARVRFIEDYAKIERVAILDSYQGKGYGKEIMKAILFDLKYYSKAINAKLGSQIQAISFYEKLGFKICGEEYIDAGILHRDMILKLDQFNLYPNSTLERG